MSKNRWWKSVALVPRTAARTIGMFHSQGMTRFVPFFVFLLLGAVVLWLANAIAPLAPFVYSLF